MTVHLHHYLTHLTFSEKFPSPGQIARTLMNHLTDQIDDAVLQTLRIAIYQFHFLA